MRNCIRVWMFGVVVLVMAACGSGAGDRDIVGPRYVAEGSSEPEIERVVDLGDLPTIPPRGALPTDRSDGVFVIGELILVEGDDFGKLPTIQIGGRPAESLARTGAGGIVCRIPTEVPGGPAQVVVSHPEGKDSFQIEVRRYALVGAVDALHAVQINDDGTAVARQQVNVAEGLKNSSLEIAGVAVSRDGRAGYALTRSKGGGMLHVLSMAAAKGIRRLASHPVRGDHLQGLVTGPGAGAVVALGAGSVTIFDARVSTAVTEAARVMIPKGADAGAMAPDGGLLAVLSRKDNELTLIDLSDLSAPRVQSTISLLPSEPVPLVKSLQFDPEGSELWVLAGDNPESTVAGSRPTTIVVVSLEAQTAKVVRTVRIGVASPPLDLAVATRESTLAATAIRSTRKRAAMVVATAEASVVAKPLETSSEPLGKLLLADLDGAARPLGATSALHLDNSISHDRRFVLSAARRHDDGKQVVGFAVTPLESGKTTFLHLSDEPKGNLMSPLQLAVAP